MKILQIISTLLFFSQVKQAEKDKEKAFDINFHQNDYQLKMEHVDLVNTNKKYVDMKIKTFKHNRTCTAFNFSVDFKIAMGNQLEVVVQAYKFASNEYRLFPMRFELNACDAFKNNVFGTKDFLKCGNFTGCPILKGKRDVCNFVADPAYLPPFIPNGKYMWELQCFYLSEEVGIIRAYLEIFRPFL